MMEKRKVLKSFVSVGTFDEVVNKIFDLPISKVSSYVCFANVHMIVEAYRNTRFSEVLNIADIVTADGLPISKYIGFFDGYPQEKVSGPDVMPVILKQAEESKKSVFFYGSTDNILDQLVTRVKKDFPQLQITGAYSPPFRVLTPEEDEWIVNMINSSYPDFVFVALGCPKQEKWMYEHVGKINACMLGVGQAFEIYAGMNRRAPIWMRERGLEWLYRLCREPGRLWKRYLTTNSYFIFMLIQIYLMEKIFKVESKIIKQQNT